jgi:hypothetical protein
MEAVVEDLVELDIERLVFGLRYDKEERGRDETDGQNGLRSLILYPPLICTFSSNTPFIPPFTSFLFTSYDPSLLQCTFHQYTPFSPSFLVSIPFTRNALSHARLPFIIVWDSIDLIRLYYLWRESGYHLRLRLVAREFRFPSFVNNDHLVSSSSMASELTQRRPIAPLPSDRTLTDNLNNSTQTKAAPHPALVSFLPGVIFLLLRSRSHLLTIVMVLTRFGGSWSFWQDDEEGGAVRPLGVSKTGPQVLPPLPLCGSPHLPSF